MNKARRGEKVSFVDILREVKNHKPTQNDVRVTEDGTIFNMQQATENDAVLKPTLPFDGDDQNTVQQESEGIISHISGFVGGLFGKKKSNTKGGSEDESQASNVEKAGQERITIYEDQATVEEEIAAIYPVYEIGRASCRERV